MQIFASCKIFILTMFLQGYIIHEWCNLSSAVVENKLYFDLLLLKFHGKSCKNAMDRKFQEILCLLCKRVNLCTVKGQLNSEWIYEVIVSPKMPTKDFPDFCPGSLLEGRTEIWKNFGCHFGRNDDLINSFWI